MPAQDPMMPHGQVPGYVPQHLQGKVWDFRNEDDGTVSFLHPEAALGLSPQDSRVRLNEGQYKATFDQQHRLGNFTDSMKTQHAPLERAEKTTGQYYNDLIADKLRGAYHWGTSSQGKAVGTTGLLSALAGGVGGYMWGKQTGESPMRKALLLSLLAGATGAIATGVAQSSHNKREAWLSKNASSMDVAQGIIRSLENDPSLSGHDRAKILTAVARLRNEDRDQLYRLLKTSLGAGVGVLAVRFLGAKGLLPMLAGGILGGFLGGRSNDELDHNPYGQVSITNYL